MPNAIHNLDLCWALIAGVAMLYPLWRLAPLLHRQSIRDLTAIVLILGTYPLLLAIHHLTPFDLGLVYAITTPLPALYFFVTTAYIGIRVPRETIVRAVLLGASGVLSMLALTNAWHGSFAMFEMHQPGRPNHLIDDEVPGFGMGIMHAMAFVLVVLTAVMGVIQFMRSRFRWLPFLLTVVMPTAALWSFTATQRWTLLEDLHISAFILTTTVLLLCTNYALARNHFTETRLITRSKLMRVLPDAVVAVTSSGRIIDCNPAFARLNSGSQTDQRKGENLIGQPLEHVLEPLSAALLDWQGDSFELVLQDLVFSVAAKVVGRSGKRGRHLLVVLRDITEQKTIHQALEHSEARLKAANAALKRLSSTDSLTGLANRRFFQQHLEDAINRAARDRHDLGLLAIDVDFFKRINDEHGHQVGDQALCHIARVLEQTCRSADVLARIGGEEFTVLLTNTDAAGLSTAAERFREAVAANPLDVNDELSIDMTVSIGATLYLQGEATRSFLTRADTALYDAKRAGRNTCWTDVA